MSDGAERILASILSRLDAPLTRSMANALGKALGLHRMRDRLSAIDSAQGQQWSELEALHRGLADLRGDVTARTEELERQVQGLRSALRGLRRPIERVELADCSVFVYVDDHMAQFIRVSHRTAADVADEPVHRLIDYYANRGLRACYLEIGCNFGLELVRTAKYVVARGLDVPVFAFDPGEAGELVPFTLQDNDLADRVVFEKVAASDTARPVLVFGEGEHSENNRIVNANVGDTGFASYVMPAMRVDDYLEAHGVDREPIFKIDTQGAELEVLQGFARTLEQRLAAGVCEFTPWALATRVNPVDVLAALDATHTIVDLGFDRAYRRVVPPGDFAPFAARVDATPERWTDLLLLPRALPELPRLFVSSPLVASAG